MDNLGLMTNDELKDKKNELINEFEEQKSIIAKAYKKMMDLKAEYDEIDNILNKRLGNN